ncbi:galactokinase [Actinocorallia sp. A-T 12471]|uniref:galactokinase n=1 Tax=Actinocorallia sp. A-T 12471 TaxID=3089813 RepID=UPI0029D1F9D2|nr:galactokinase [Actinocorallia sp. A-T 12471]MDX6740198.1 galactokinase [Actinocorallia sp. A-T 12471]
MEVRARRAAMRGAWRAPGRVNLIGEHTDYNDGFVLPFALPQGITVEGEARADDVLELYSGKDSASVDLAKAEPGSVSGWAAYVVGVAACLRAAGHRVGGAELHFSSDLPIGAGLSSSAALECATAVALRDMYAIPIDDGALARIAQQAENVYAGVPCGILDQSASMLCREGHALLLDCRDQGVTQIPVDLGPYRVLVVDTRSPHRLGDGDYAERRGSCERAARRLGLAALRDVTDLPAALAALDDPRLRRRVRHVVEENRRVTTVVELLRLGAITEIGDLLTASHLSLRDLYEVSWPEADVAVAAAVNAGALGARMVGGGFGGSVIALAHRDALPSVRTAVASAYAERGWTRPTFLEAVPGPGAGRV